MFLKRQLDDDKHNCAESKGTIFSERAKFTTLGIATRGTTLYR
jgi:hypothetical protein